MKLHSSEGVFWKDYSARSCKIALNKTGLRDMAKGVVARITSD